MLVMNSSAQHCSNGAKILKKSSLADPKAIKNNVV
jgi:hypothetical protein